MGLFSTIYLAVPGCTWLYLTVPGYTWLYSVPWSAMIYLSAEYRIMPLTGTGLNALVYTGLNVQRL